MTDKSRNFVTTEKLPILMEDDWLSGSKMKFTGIYHDYSELWILLSSCLREGTD
jgi:hypothetical protein